MQVCLGVISGCRLHVSVCGRRLREATGHGSGVFARVCVIAYEVRVCA